MPYSSFISKYYFWSIWKQFWKFSYILNLFAVHYLDIYGYKFITIKLFYYLKFVDLYYFTIFVKPGFLNLNLSNKVKFSIFYRVVESLLFLRVFRYFEIFHSNISFSSVYRWLQNSYYFTFLKLLEFIYSYI